MKPTVIIDDYLCPAMTADFNDAEVLRFNKCAVTQPTRKLAECYDYPEPDLAEFYDHLANYSRSRLDSRWARKAEKLRWGRRERTFYVRRQK